MCSSKEATIAYWLRYGWTLLAELGLKLVPRWQKSHLQNYITKDILVRGNERADRLVAFFRRIAQNHSSMYTRNVSKYLRVWRLKRVCETQERSYHGPSWA